MATLLDVSGSHTTITGCSFKTSERPEKQVYSVFFVAADDTVSEVTVHAFDPAMAVVLAVLDLGLEEAPERVVVKLVG